MGQKILKIAIVIALVTTLTMANFILLGANMVTYAVDAITAETSTSHKNIGFMAYFKDSNGNSVNSIDTQSNTEDLKIYVQVSVKKEGYFDGIISLDIANFKFKDGTTNENINKIEGNVVYLNQINAGETKEIEIPIEILKQDNYDLSLLNMQSSINIGGTYKDSTQKDINITGTRTVVLNLVNSYNNESGPILNQNIITNKVVNYNGTEKRIMQIQVEAGIENNLLPIENTMLEISTPKILNKNPSEVLVNSINTLVTNGNKISKDDWQYDSSKGIININLSNNSVDNKVSWIKNGNDIITITYIFDTTEEIAQQKTDANLKVELYGSQNTILETNNNIEILPEEKDSIITSEINLSTPEMYKGKLYAGIDKDISYVSNINVNLNNVAEETNITENQILIEGENLSQSINATYKTSTLNKTNIEEILGTTGELSILNAETNEIITKINSLTESDENGNIVVTYPEGVNQIKITTTKPENIGKIIINTTKTIHNIEKEIVKKATTLKLEAGATYISNSETTTEVISSSIETLKETTTSATLETNKTELSTMSSNNVEIRAVLNSKNENNELYKNPTIQIQLPQKIESIKVNSIKLLYEDELKIVKATLKNNMIEINLEGEQTKYKEEAIEGATIIINADLTTSNKIPSSSEKISLTYTNGNAVHYENDATQGYCEKDLNIVSYAGLVTISKIQDYNLEVVNNQGEKTTKIDTATEARNVEVQNNIVNNQDSAIEDVKILGTFPTNGAVESNNMEVQVTSPISVEGIEGANVYYTTNENATDDLNLTTNKWSETIQNGEEVKKYLITIDTMGVSEEAELKYNIEIPENLEYNEVAKQGYIVNYANTATALKATAQSDDLTLETGKGAIVDTTLKATIGGEEVTESPEGSIITYAVTVSNTGSEDVSNVKAVGTVPEGTTYIELNIYNGNATETQENAIGRDYQAYVENAETKDVEFNIESLAVGESVTKEYSVRVNSGSNGKNISNKVTTSYGEVKKESNEVTNNITASNLQLTLYTPTIDNNEKPIQISSGYSYRYVLEIKNTSNIEQKNVKVEFAKNDNNIEFGEIYYELNDEQKTESENNYITVDSISAGETILVNTNIYVNYFTDAVNKNINISAQVTVDNITYKSNVVNSIAKTYLVDLSATSINSETYVKSGDTVEYHISIKNTGDKELNNLILKNILANEMSLSTVKKGETELIIDEDYYQIKYYGENNQVEEDAEDTGEEITTEITETEGEEDLDIKQAIDISIESILPGETQMYVIQANIDEGVESETAQELSNISILQKDGMELARVEAKEVLQPSTDTADSDTGEQGDGSEEETPGNNDEKANETVEKVISGVAWLDANADGEKDSNETLLSGIQVKLLDTTTNEIAKDSDGTEITATTNSSGFYSLNKIPQGEYLVIFEYDTSKYILTDYEKDGVLAKNNSKAISNTLNINGEEKTVATSEIIAIENDNIANINIGLKDAQSYDLKLDKTISKVTVQNSKGTKINEYSDATFAKVEIDSKLLNATTVIVEYNIKVTNEGEISAYVKQIADYLATDYKFSSELNKDWYQSGGTLYNTSLSNEKIEPGESKTVTLIVTKQMTENNTGLINNTAEIAGTYNEQGLADKDSTEANKVKGEDDMGSADLIISIKTGQVVATVVLILTTIIILAAGSYIITTTILKKKVI